jgi:N-acetylglucosamine kinase-like BadF-type ATPase
MARPDPAPPTKCVVGIDAGGTRTLGLLAPDSGTVGAEARGAGWHLQTHGELQVEPATGAIALALDLLERR